MPQRLTPLEVSYLVLDTAHTPAHVATVDIFEAGPDGLDYERLLALIRDRIAYVPRYRQRIRGVPGRLAGPVWVDDESFDLTFHVRRSALPRPGTLDQLRDFVGRVVARRMDRSRPLWEMYVVEGLAPDRFAVVAKTHLSLVDGVDTVDIGQVLLDSDPDQRPAAAELWHPAPEPSAAELVAGAVWESAQDPAQAFANLQGALTGALGIAVAVGEAVGGIGGALGELAEDALRGGRPRTKSALTGTVSEQRRVATVAVPLEQLKAIRDEHDHTVNDVVLAVITGALRSWLLTRGEAVAAGTGLVALVPMSVTEDGGVPTSLGSQVAPHVQTLPVGEPNAVMRLHQVAYGTQAHKDSGRSVDARTLSDIAGFAPTTLHALGVRVSAEVMRRQHDVLITNVPGPQVPLYAAGERMVASYPVLPLGPGHLLAIGVTSYDGEAFFGLTGDRDALSDLDVLANCIEDAVEELRDTTALAGSYRQPTRKASAAAKRAAAKKAAARAEAAARAAGQRRAAVRNLASKAVEIGSAGLSASGRRPTAPAESAESGDDAAVRQPPATKAGRPEGPGEEDPGEEGPGEEGPGEDGPGEDRPR